MIGQKFPDFKMIAVKPFFNFPEENEVSAFEYIDQDSFKGQWKVFYFYPRDFTFVCPTEIIAFSQLNDEFNKRNTVVLGGSPDNEHVKLAWRRNHPDLKSLNHYSFVDAAAKLSAELGILQENNYILRATYIIDENNIIQHVSMLPEKIGRNPLETLRLLDALQSDDIAFCNRPIGGFNSY